jgi:hypothetical protein
MCGHMSFLFACIHVIKNQKHPEEKVLIKSALDYQVDVT